MHDMQVTWHFLIKYYLFTYLLIKIYICKKFTQYMHHQLSPINKLRLIKHRHIIHLGCIPTFFAKAQLQKALICKVWRGNI